MRQLMNKNSKPFMFIVFICLFFSCQNKQIHSQTEKKELIPLDKLSKAYRMDLVVNTTTKKVTIQPGGFWVPFCRTAETPVSVMLNNKKEEMNYDNLTNENTKNHYQILNTLKENKSLCADFERLEVVGYNIDSMDFSIFPNLQILYIGFSPFSKFPSSAKHLSNLKSISFAECGLNELPEVIYQLDNLEQLFLGDYLYGANNISSFPKELANLKKLKTLFMPHNKLKCLSSEICGLQNLEELLVPANRIDSISPDIYKLKHLKSLNILGSDVKELPSEIAKLSSLKNISLEACSKLNFNNAFSYLSKIDSLEEVDISSNEFKKLPDNFLLLKNISKLKLRACRGLNIAQTVSQLSNLKQLKFISLKYCDLSELPDNLNKIKHIEELDFENNPLVDLKNIDQVSELRVLNLQDNEQLEIKECLKNLAKLNKLSQLNLSRCNLKVVPEEIAELKNLKELNLWANWNIDIEKSLNNIIKNKSIETIDISQIGLDYIPECLYTNSTIKYIYCTHNNVAAMEYIDLLEKNTNIKMIYLDNMPEDITREDLINCLKAKAAKQD
jgi:Leucine-rich repeat (LRR) protein